MKIRLKIKLTGMVDGKRPAGIGEEMDVDDAIGASLCSRGYAEPVATKDEEKATAPEPEKRGPGRPRKTAE